MKKCWTHCSKATYFCFGCTSLEGPTDRWDPLLSAAACGFHACGRDLAGGNLLAEDGPWATDTVSYGYQNGLRVALTNQQPAGVWTNGFGYDAARRLTSVTSTAGTFAYLYTNVAGLRSAGALVARIALPNTAYITNTFDASARLLGTRLNNSAHTTLNAHGYQLNAANQRWQQTRTDGSTVGYTYDNLAFGVRQQFLTSQSTS